MRVGRIARVLAVNVVVLCGLFGIVEVGFRVYDRAQHRTPQAVVSPKSPPYNQFDSTLGYRGQTAGGRYRSLKANGADTVYDVIYTLLPGGWRYVPQPGERSDSTFVAFFGCSFTHGEGVGDSATLPAAFADAMPGNATVYNRGFHGWGPQSMLAMMEAPPSFVNLKQRRGIAVLSSIDHHIDRVRGTFDVVSVWGGNMPRYELGADGIPFRTGSFASSRPVRQFVYWTASKSLVLSRLFSIRSEPSPEDWSLMAGIVKRSCDLFAQRYDSLGCYFVMWPTSQSMHRELAPRLRKLGVRVLDYSQLWNYEEDRMKHSIVGDGHPNAATFRILASHLVHDIGQ